MPNAVRARTNLWEEVQSTRTFRLLYALLAFFRMLNASFAGVGWALAAVAFLVAGNLLPALTCLFLIDLAWTHAHQRTQELSASTHDEQSNLYEWIATRMPPKRPTPLHPEEK